MFAHSSRGGRPLASFGLGFGRPSVRANTRCSQVRLQNCCSQPHLTWDCCNAINQSKSARWLSCGCLSTTWVFSKALGWNDYFMKSVEEHFSVFLTGADRVPFPIIDSPVSFCYSRPHTWFVNANWFSRKPTSNWRIRCCSIIVRLLSLCACQPHTYTLEI